MSGCKSILIGGYDFEQKIHRGINFYAKSLILSLYPRKLYLLTPLSLEKENIILLLKILKYLNDPYSIDNKRKVLEYIKYKIGFRSFRVLNNSLEHKEIGTKLDFLSYIAGFYNIPSIYTTTFIQTKLFPKKPLKINFNNIDLFITVSPMSVRVNVPIIQTLHDVIPLNCLYSPSDDDSRFFYYRIKNMLEYSDIVISVSNYSKEECLKIFPGYEDKIIVTYQPVPVDEDIKKLTEEKLVQKSVLKKYDLEEDNFLFYVGMLEKRKNIKQLIEAFLAVYEKIKIPLVLAGALGFGKEEFEHYLRNKKLKKKILYIGYINNIEKLVLLRTARAFLFPSFEEGFGLPPLEAMLMKTPVLTSSVSALPEVCGEGALYVNPYNIKEIAEGIVEIVCNEHKREELIRNGTVQIEKFSFKNFKKRIEEIIAKL